MNITPINNTILVKIIKKNIKNLSGILIPNIDEKPGQGIIISKSKINKFLKSNIKIGQHIIFNKYTGQKLKFDNIDYLIIKETDILALLN